MSASTLNVAILGAGRIGAVHARTIATSIPEARVAAVADPDVAAARALAARHGDPIVREDPREALSAPGVDAVLVCSSTDTHRELVVAAARAGKQIFCEKPLALDLEDIDEMLAVVDDAGVALQVGFNRRFDPGFARVRERIAAGAIGEPELLRITSRDPEPPPPSYVERSGGIFLDMTVHDLDMARFLMGREVEEVHALGSCLVDPAIGAAGDVDTALITLRFEGGALGVIDNSRRATYGYDQRVEVHGSQGMVRNADDLPGDGELATTAPPRPASAPPFFMERYAEAYAAQLRSFVRCLLDGRAPEVGGRDGRMAILLGHAAKLSLAEGRPVSPSEIAEDLAEPRGTRGDPTLVV